MCWGGSIHDLPLVVDYRGGVRHAACRFVRLSSAGGWIGSKHNLAASTGTTEWGAFEPFFFLYHYCY